ncbi:MAG: recombinase family protein [Lentisphaerae bacterium]|nr:recombinase family protein [Lentisphaerota bacterium]
MRVAIYARVSKSDQQTLPLQINQLSNYADNRNWKIVKVVKEIGSAVRKRPKREELIKQARCHEIDVIIVWKLDRWGRSVSDLISSLNEFKEIGIGFVSITEALDLTTSAGRAMAGLLAIFAEFERDLLRERVCAGLEQAKKKGVRLGRPPVAMAKANQVKKLFKKNFSKSEIARRLGIDRRSVRRILENQTD